MSEILAEVLVVEILGRLPMKDLARCRCVCKTWRDLINHRDFAERYRDISPARFVLFYDKGFYLLDVEGKNLVFKNPHKLGFPLDQAMIDESTCVMHCHGTLCVTLKNHTLIVWNPYSNQFKIVPNPDINRYSNTINGFGYDPVSKDYKLVTFIDQVGSSTAQVFEFRTDSWRETVSIPCPDWHYRERIGTHLDQYIYWIAYRSNVDRFILCFNLSTYEYRKLALPVYNQGVACSWLGVTSQKLCVIEYVACKKEIRVSVMEKTGAWNKIISLSMSDFNDIQDDKCDYQVEFVSFTKKNDLVVTFTGYYDGFETEAEEREKKKILLYKTGASTFEQVRLCNSLAGFRFLTEYVETPLIIDPFFI